ncbi:MAG: DUF58 domain-containing protein [Proteobacteria bacterium]|nr:DUF58 domain-containing protein [Pseudomonadota bacterium]
MTTLEPEIGSAELARAARILAIRVRREATGLFAGGYASAFRGGGMEFHESRPYVPGDDVRAFDWNALARTGEPFVKRYREERDLTVWIALDVSASMRFGALGRVKAGVAAHAAALLAAAAGQTGDRVGLVAFADVVRAEVPAARGPSHIWHVVQTAGLCAGSAAGGTRLGVGIEALVARARQRSISVLLSDFRDPALLDPSGVAGLLALSRRHDVVCAVLYDPREESLPSVGLVRVEDPERPGRTQVLHTGRKRARARYRRAWAARCAALERALRSAGCDVVWMRTDRDPLRTWMHFFEQRAARSRVAS